MYFLILKRSAQFTPIDFYILTFQVSHILKTSKNTQVWIVWNYYFLPEVSCSISCLKWNCLKGLKCLFLESNGIKRLEGLDCQRELRCLYLAHNLLTKIENLEPLVHLDTLDVSHNLLTRLENLGLSHVFLRAMFPGGFSCAACTFTACSMSACTHEPPADAQQVREGRGYHRADALPESLEREPLAQYDRRQGSDRSSLRSDAFAGTLEQMIYICSFLYTFILLQDIILQYEIIMPYAFLSFIESAHSHWKSSNSRDSQLSQDAHH